MANTQAAGAAKPAATLLALMIEQYFGGGAVQIYPRPQPETGEAESETAVDVPADAAVEVAASGEGGDEPAPAASEAAAEPEVAELTEGGEDLEIGVFIIGPSHELASVLKAYLLANATEPPSQSEGWGPFLKPITGTKLSVTTATVLSARGPVDIDNLVAALGVTELHAGVRASDETSIFARIIAGYAPSEEPDGAEGEATEAFPEAYFAFALAARSGDQLAVPIFAIVLPGAPDLEFTGEGFDPKAYPWVRLIVSEEDEDIPGGLRGEDKPDHPARILFAEVAEYVRDGLKVSGFYVLSDEDTDAICGLPAALAAETDAYYVYLVSAPPAPVEATAPAEPEATEVGEE